MLKIKNDDLLNSTENYIAHQCNCASRNALGIARSIFSKFKYANTYSQKRTPGAIDVLGNGSDKRFVINMYGQFYPGRPAYNETSEIRLLYFTKCLENILEIPDLESVAFPWKIGCGLAGGNWDTYYELLNSFSDKTDAEVILYHI